MTLAHRPCHLLRAVVEGLACELTRHLMMLAEAGFSAQRLTMCGSAATSRLTPHIIADVTRRPVACLDAFDVSALGAAAIARALVEGELDPAYLTNAAAEISHTTDPDRNESRYSALLAQYLAPFDTRGTKGVTR